MANYFQLPDPTVKTSTEIKPMVMLSFGSDNHEIGVFDLLNFTKDCLNPEIYVSSLPSQTAENEILFLKDVTKYESSCNIRNLFGERNHYDYLPDRSPLNDIIAFYSDPLNLNQNMMKEKWLTDSTNSYNLTNTLFTQQNYASKILCFPRFSNKDLRSPGAARDAENIFVSAGNDMNIRYWNLSYGKYYHINNVDFKRRTYHTHSDTMTVINEFTGKDVGSEPNGSKINYQELGFSEYQFKNGSKLGAGSYEKNMLAHAGHTDAINDLVWLENHNLLASCSRDHTIKVWK